MDHSSLTGDTPKFPPAYLRALKTWNMLAGLVIVSIWIEAYFTHTLTHYLAWAAPIFGPGFLGTAAYVQWRPQDARRGAGLGYLFIAGYFTLAYAFALVDGPWEYSYLIFSNAVWTSTTYLYGSLFLGRRAFRANLINASLTSALTVACAVRYMMAEIPHSDKQYGLQPYFYSLLAQWAMLLGGQAINELSRAVRTSERQVIFLRQVVAEMVGHEIGTPLQSMVNNLGLLHMLVRKLPGATSSPDAMAKVDKAVGNLQRSVQQIEHVLMNASASSKSQVDDSPTPHLDEIDLPHLLEHVVDDHRARAIALGLTLRLDRSGPMPNRVTTDRTRLTQIVTNLVTNALKYTDEGEIVVRCTSTRRDELEIRVTDTGIGIPTDALNSIFEPYVRLPEAKQRAVAGRGLGLAVVKRELAVLQGRIDVQSVHGQGSSFSVKVPATVSSFVMQPDASVPRILVVDDSADALTAAQEMLDGQGYVCKTAAHGGEALAILAAETFDLVFLDIQMPVADGYQVAQRTRQDQALEANAYVPIVGMSASIPELSDAAYFNFFLKKPFKFSSELVKSFLAEAVRHESPSSHS